MASFEIAFAVEADEQADARDLCELLWQGYDAWKREAVAPLASSVTVTGRQVRSGA